jgi:hypothetical protein
MTEDDFIATVLRNPINAAIVERLGSLALHDCWLVSGALFQTVWNVKTRRAPAYGIKDYDIFYFDRDTSWNAEDVAIKRANAIFADLGADIEVRNQARVHLWYEEKFGRAYPPANRATDGIDRFLMPCAQIGIRKNGSAYKVYAPHGLDDVSNLIVRPNVTANFHAERYHEKAERWQKLWPELTILEATSGDAA